MRILVTGGCGFIGTNFVRYALSEGHDIINLDKLTYAGNRDSLSDIEENGRYRFFQGDIADDELVKQLLFDHKPSAIVHLAAESHVDRSIDGPEPFIKTNILGTFRLLENARRYWRDLSPAEKDEFRFLHVSTDEVFGSLGPEGFFTEESPYAPRSPYSASKASSDHLVRSYFHTWHFPALITNCSNNYGPFQFPEKLIPFMIIASLKGRKLPVYGDGSNVRDWLYVEDHCAALLRVLGKGRVGETYLIGGNSESTNLDVVGEVARILDEVNPRHDGKSYARQISFVADRPGHDKRYAINADKIRSELDWEPKVTFKEGLRKTICWYLGNMEWIEKILEDKYRLERLGLEGVES